MDATHARRDLSWVVALRLVASAIVVATGFRAVSDDDYARVVIAEAWAQAPKLDPSGTSWLPLPFWVTGAAHALFGGALGVARAVAAALGVLSSILVYVAARWVGPTDPRLNRRAALLGALLATLFPWSARLGVATVPELPAAALALVAVASVASRDPRRRLFGAAALLAATLSRYDAWPVAAGFAAFSLWDARAASARDRPRLLQAALLAALGPALWIAWNHLARGDAFDFVSRVAAYKQALGGAEPGALSRALEYPRAALGQEPELFGLVLAGVAIAYFSSGNRYISKTLSRYARPLLLIALMVTTLAVGAARDAAPTHHPERALLLALFLLALFSGELWARVTLDRSVRASEKMAFALACVVLVGALVRSSDSQKPSFAERNDEVAVGEAAAVAASRGDAVLVEAVDYGFFAISAAIGRPDDVVIDRSLDPRRGAEASSFASTFALRQRLDETGATHFIGRPSAVTEAVGGEAVFTRGGLALWAAPRAESASKQPK